MARKPGEPTLIGSRGYWLIIRGFVLMTAGILLAFDYYKHATTYEGYFHLGFGAYLITSSYFLLVFDALIRVQQVGKDTRYSVQ